MPLVSKKWFFESYQVFELSERVFLLRLCQRTVCSIHSF